MNSFAANGATLLSLNNQINIMKKSLLFAFALIAFTLSNAQSYKPGMTLKKGQQFEVTSTVSGTINQALGEMTVESNLKSKVNVLGETAKGFDVVAGDKHFDFKIGGMGQDMSYSSDKKNDDNPMADAFKDLTRTDTFAVDNQGYAWSASPEKAASKKDEKKKDMMGMMMNSMIGASAGGSPIFNLLPAFGELKVGESLKDSSENKAEDGSDKVTNTYTLTEIKDGKVKIAINSVSSIEKTMQVEQMGMNMSVTMKSVNTSKGEMIVEQATGLLSIKTITTETDGSMSVSGMDLPITGTSTAVITVKKL